MSPKMSLTLTKFFTRLAAPEVQAQYLQRSCQDQPPFLQSQRRGLVTWTTEIEKKQAQRMKVESFPADCWGNTGTQDFLGA